MGSFKTDFYPVCAVDVLFGGLWISSLRPFFAANKETTFDKVML